MFGTGAIAFEPKVFGSDPVGVWAPLGGISANHYRQGSLDSATTVEKDGKKEVVFATGDIAYEPKILNQILSGYHY